MEWDFGSYSSGPQNYSTPSGIFNQPQTVPALSSSSMTITPGASLLPGQYYVLNSKYIKYELPEFKFTLLGPGGVSMEPPPAPLPGKAQSPKPVPAEKPIRVGRQFDFERE